MKTDRSRKRKRSGGDEMEDTICAIATKLGVGAISIIRVSGRDAISKVNALFEGKNLEEVESHTIHYGWIKEKEEVLDEILVSVMRAPKTFTREDVVEINCHGGILATKSVLEALLRTGIRMAEPGEFTKRAFLNGRIDLAQAEAVMELIESKNDTAKRLALSALQGSTTNLVKDFREQIKQVIASIEVNIDYPEYEDIEQMTEEKLEKLLEDLQAKLEEIILQSKRKQQLKNGIETAIIGRPNVGKSSLLNHLLEEEKAIVTSIEGTTRDIVEGDVNLDGISLHILDTAGLRETEDVVEKMGVEKSKQILKKAQLVFFLLDGSKSLQEEDKKMFSSLEDEKTILVLNKKDQGIKIKKSDLPFSHVVVTTTKTKDGLDELKQEVKTMFQQDEIQENDAAILFNARQLALASQAQEKLKEAKCALEEGVELDMISLDLQEILETLGEITGENYQDEILDTLFANFCVGK